MPVVQSIPGRLRDLGGFWVSRILPAPQRRSLGPFVFFDEMGPADFAPGAGIDVRPHPHIGLATVTYLFAGGLTHRDSLGTVLDINPGAVNWMTAGRGIVHSERSPPALRAAGHRLHGIQAWLALPVAQAEAAPAFDHHPAESLPVVHLDGGTATVIAGALFGAASPVVFPHPVVYADIRLEAGAGLALDPAWGEVGVYPVTGDCRIDDDPLTAGALAIAAPGPARLVAQTAVHVMIVGGAPLPEPRILEWNFVSHSADRIAVARADWRARRFPRVPGDSELMPLPD